MSCPLTEGGGGQPPSAKKVNFFRQNVQKIQHVLKTLFLFNNFLYCHPYSEYRFQWNIYKKEEKKTTFFPLSGLRGEGSMIPKKIFYALPNA